MKNAAPNSSKNKFAAAMKARSQRCVCVLKKNVFFLFIVLLKFSLSMYPQEEPVFTELKRMNEDEKVAFNLDIASAGPSKTRYNQSKSLIKQYGCSLGDNNYVLFL